MTFFACMAPFELMPSGVNSPVRTDMCLTTIVNTGQMSASNISSKCGDTTAGGHVSTSSSAAGGGLNSVAKARTI